MAVYVPATERWKASDFAEVFFERIGSKFGLPKGIVSDRGALFTSAFWTEVCFQCRMKRRLSTAYHPQTDGQTERQNQTLEIFLRCFVSDQQDDWASLLPHAEFAYNNATHSSTNQTPFQMVMGKHPRWSAMHEDVHHEGEAPIAVDRIKRIREVRDLATERLRSAVEQQQRYYNRKHIPRVFRPGDLVWLNAKNLRLKLPSRKMAKRFVGPFRIEEAVGSQAYRLRLPPSYRIHDTFHVSLLTEFHQREGEPLANTAAPELAQDGSEVWEVEKIIDQRKRHGQQEYRLRWKDYDEEWDTWHTEDAFENMDDLLVKWQQERGVRNKR